MLTDLFKRWSGALVTTRKELYIGTLGAGLGLLSTEAICRWTLGITQPWFVIPMGASAVLLFAVPASPLAQPWSIIGGNTVSALSGVICYWIFGETGFAISLAGALAVGSMFFFRCVHPPGGAIALTAVLGGSSIHALVFQFVLSPVLLNSAILLALAVIFNKIAGRKYPHYPKPAPNMHSTNDLLPSQRAGIQRQDLDAALASYGEVLDINPGDLQEIMIRAQMQAQRRHWGHLLCKDIMSRDLITINPDASVADAWHLLAKHRIKSVPVVTKDNLLVGIVSVPDFFIDRHNPAMQTIPRMINSKYVHEIMSTNVRTAKPDQPLSELAKTFTDLGMHYLPVTDESEKLIGMLTQSDLLGALFSKDVS